MRMRDYKRWAVGLMVLLFGLFSSSAMAGIIVTEGKISRCALTLKSAHLLWSLGEWPDDLEGCAPADDETDEDSSADDDSSSSDESGHHFDDDEDELDLDDEELGDLDSTPEGYTCSDLGNGIELCESDDDEEEEEEESNAGAGVGSAAGGSWTNFAASGEGENAPSAEESVAGCQAGSSADPSLVLSWLLLVGLALARRRTARVH